MKRTALEKMSAFSQESLKKLKEKKSKKIKQKQKKLKKNLILSKNNKKIYYLEGFR